MNWSKELKRIKSRNGRRPRIIYHFHGILRRERDSGFRTLNHFLLRQEEMIGLADRIVCPSSYEYNNFCGYFPLFIDKVSVIENTIESYPSDTRRIDEIKKGLDIRQGDVVLSDIYINSSLSESFSLSTHESALCNNALLLNCLPVFEKFKDAARNRLSRKAGIISNRFLDRNRLKDDLRKLFPVRP